MDCDQNRPLPKAWRDWVRHHDGRSVSEWRGKWPDQGSNVAHGGQNAGRAAESANGFRGAQTYAIRPRRSRVHLENARLDAKVVFEAAIPDGSASKIDWPSGLYRANGEHGRARHLSDRRLSGSRPS